MSVKTPARYGAIPSDAPAPANPAQPQSTSDLSFISRARNVSRSLFAAPRPWSQLFELSALSRPASYADAMVRVRRNLSYFRFNYSVVLLFILFVSLLWHPISLIVFLIVLVAWYYFYFSRDSPVVLFNRTLDDGTVLCGLGLITVLALVFTDVGFNVFMSLLVGVVVVGLHAAFRITDDLFLDQESAAEGGLHSVVTGQPLITSYTRI